MKKVFSLSILAIFVFSGMAFAVLDPDPDGMSIYFDSTADTYELSEAMLFMVYPVYLILTNPTTTNPVLSWEARVVYAGDAGYGAPDGYVSWDFTNGGVNNGSAVDLCIDTSADPIAITGDAVILATAELVWTHMGGYASFTMGRATNSATFPDSPGYFAEAGVGTAANSLLWDWDNPCAWVRDMVPNETKSWGEVKALF